MERLDRFMARANASYYATRDPFADFATAPEISQAFGEILGLWAAVVWQSVGRPDPVILAEAGPGRGTLMQDALSAIGKMAPDFWAALRLHLIETSPRLRGLQQESLPGGIWHESINDLPPGPLLLIGNEFLDALPIRQFVRRGDGWAERFVQNGAFAEQPAEPPAFPTLTNPIADGAIVEFGEAARSVASRLGGRLAQQGGAALFLDYGPENSAPGDSLQALRAARPADPLVESGSADLTAHVDFQAFAHAARQAGAAVHGPVPQGLFLARLGLFQRSERLARGQTPAKIMAIMEATRRLTEPDRMGRLFKAIALCHPAAPIPPGFET
jgi:SAM-dependent MidA family methyltransferase